MPSQYSIRDLERISGIKAHTLRIWEQRYHILKPSRTDTNIRFYNDEDLKRILNISILNNNGYKISSIARLSDSALLEEAEKHLDANKSENEQVSNLVICLMEMDEDRFEKTLNNAIGHFGFESTVENILFPFLRRLGDMWQVGMVSPSQEHYISNLIRQKLIARLDQVTPAKNPAPSTFLFFLPNTELHEMGLLYAWYLVKLRGHKCVYLGQCVPLEDLLLIAGTVKPDYVVTIMTINIPDEEVLELIKACETQIPSAKLLLSGRLVFNLQTSHKLGTERTSVFADFKTFKQLIGN